MGAVITISALAFETFFQQIVSYPERPIVQGNGSISTAISYGLANKQAKPACRTCASRAKAILWYKLTHKVMNGVRVSVHCPHFKLCTTRVHPTSQLGLHVSNSDFLPCGRRSPAARLSKRSSNDTVPSAPSLCGTSNCIWAQYSSLGVCTQCKNISSFVRYICKNHTLISFTDGSSTHYGCGYTLNGTMLTGTYLNTYWVEELSHSPCKP